MWAVNGTYFLSTSGFGTHELKAGYQGFDEVRDVNNYQNGSDYRISLYQTIIRGSDIYPRVRTGSNTRIYWYPIFVPSEGSHYKTDSFYVNDRWVASKRWTFNLGLRYDKNDATSGDGSYKVADDSNISPRLGANWDALGNGKLQFTASYAQYVGRLAEGVGNDGDPAGRTASFNWSYGGPAINDNVNTPTADLIPTDVVIQMVMDWFFANGGTDRRPFRTAPSIPGLQSTLDPAGLKSPNVDEWTLGVGVTLGTRGIARADFVYRTWDDFYIGKTNMETGQVAFEDRFYDHNVTGNDTEGIYNREYQGIHTQAQYRFSSRFNAGLTYTWSKLIGNVTGENSGSGPISGTAGEYPEYREASWNYPTGYLSGDRRHRARLWLTYDLPTGIGDFNFSLMQRYESGQASSTDGTIDSRPYVDNPGYLTPVSGISYFFGGRGNISTDSITATDLGVQYTLPIKKIDLYVRLDAFNVFNEQAVDGFNEEILTNDDEDWLASFNPFTETPVECPQGATPEACQDMGANWQKGPNFGEPTSESSYQAPRSFRVAFGIQF
jgi:outer membrane receptor protein involved in Fe transport